MMVQYMQSGLGMYLSSRVLAKNAQGPGFSPSTAKKKEKGKNIQINKHNTVYKYNQGPKSYDHIQKNL
jgi:hypothetical protein